MRVRQVHLVHSRDALHAQNPSAHMDPCALEH